MERIGYFFLVLLGAIALIGILFGAHIGAYYTILGMGYRKQKRINLARKQHKAAPWWKKLLLSHWTEFADHHLLLVGIAWLYNLVTVTVGPVFVIGCFLNVVLSDFSRDAILFMFEFPLKWVGAYVLLMFIPDLLFNEQERRRWRGKN